MYVELRTKLAGLGTSLHLHTTVVWTLLCVSCGLRIILIIFLKSSLSIKAATMSEFGKFGPLVGSIDEGTSSARFIIFKANSSEVVAYHQKELGKHFPQEGWVEQDPLAILEVVTTCIEKAMEQLVELGGKPQVLF